MASTPPRVDSHQSIRDNSGNGRNICKDRFLFNTSATIPSEKTNSTWTPLFRTWSVTSLYFKLMCRDSSDSPLFGTVARHACSSPPITTSNNTFAAFESVKYKTSLLNFWNYSTSLRQNECAMKFDSFWALNKDRLFHSTTAYCTSGAFQQSSGDWFTWWLLTAPVCIAILPDSFFFIRGIARISISVSLRYLKTCFTSLLKFTVILCMNQERYPTAFATLGHSVLAKWINAPINCLNGGASLEFSDVSVGKLNYCSKRMFASLQHCIPNFSINLFWFIRALCNLTALPSSWIENPRNTDTFESTHTSTYLLKRFTTNLSDSTLSNAIRTSSTWTKTFSGASSRAHAYNVWSTFDWTKPNALRNLCRFKLHCFHD